MLSDCNIRSSQRYERSQFHERRPGGSLSSEPSPGAILHEETNFRRGCTKESFGDLPDKEEDDRGVGQRSLEQRKRN